MVVVHVGRVEQSAAYHHGLLDGPGAEPDGAVHSDGDLEDEVPDWLSLRGGGRLLYLPRALRRTLSGRRRALATKTGTLTRTPPVSSP